MAGIYCLYTSTGLSFNTKLTCCRVCRLGLGIGSGVVRPTRDRRGWGHYRRKKATVKLIINTRKTAGTTENPACQQTTFCDIQIKVVILLLVNISIHANFLPLKIRVTLPLTFQGHSRSKVMMSLDSPDMVSY